MKLTKWARDEIYHPDYDYYELAHDGFIINFTHIKPATASGSQWELCDWESHNVDGVTVIAELAEKIRTKMAELD